MRYQLKQFKYNNHYWNLRFIEDAHRPLRILDVGTADGYLGAILAASRPFQASINSRVARGKTLELILREQ